MTQILSQFCINVSDMDKALEFWHEVCELPIVNRVEMLDQGVLHTEHCKLEVGQKTVKVR